MNDIVGYLIPSEAAHLRDDGMGTIYALDQSATTGIDYEPLFRSRGIPPMIERLHAALADAHNTPMLENKPLIEAFTDLDVWIKKDHVITSLRSVGRKAFEESVMERYADHAQPDFLLLRNTFNEYNNIGIQGEWVGWQAAWFYRTEPNDELTDNIIELFKPYLSNKATDPEDSKALINALDMLLSARESQDIEP